MLTISCKDIAADCDFIGKANTEEELMMQFVGHVVKMYDYNFEDIMRPEVRKKLKQISASASPRHYD
jgi:predicted small metal-binding protein